MKVPKGHIWIEQGYRLFAEKGKAGLKVEILARETGKNKSSFYHYFGDMDSYIMALLDYHMVRVKKNAHDLLHADTLFPGVLKIFIDTKPDIFFHKQLRI